MLAKRPAFGNVPLLMSVSRQRWRVHVLITYLWIGLGSALGGMARFACSNLAVAWFGPSFPWGTLGINVLGSFVIGFFATLTGPDGRLLVPGDARQFVMVGLCGGYTTFSSFSLQTLNLMQDGEPVRAGLNVGASVVLCLLSVWLGYIIAAAFNAVKGS
jgi:CrcB protein